MTTKICITGDSILMTPLPEGYSGLSPLRDFIEQADVRVNNLEMVISNNDCFASTYCGGIWLTGTPDRLEDLTSFGFNCFCFANNHTMDFSYCGLESTLTALKERDLPVCGAGMSLEEATEPAMIETPKGKVAVLCISSTCDDAARAGGAGKTIPARPGLNMLRHTETYLVNQSHLEALKAIAEVTHINGRINNSKRGGYTLSKPGIFSLGSIDFKLSDKEGKTSSPNPIDMERMRLALESAGKEADYRIVCFHSHEIKGSLDEEPDYFIEEFARRCIDWGADAVVGSGTHQVKAIELYKGRPIFYSIANFIFQVDKMQHVPLDYYEKFQADPSLSIEEVEAIRSQNGTRGLETESKYYMGLMPLLEFEGDSLKKILLQPLELGFNAENKQHKGLPHPANPEVTKKLYETLNSLSAEYGTSLKMNGTNIEVVLDS